MDIIKERLPVRETAQSGTREKNGRSRLEIVLARVLAWMACMTWRWSGDWRGLRPLLMRATAHVALISVAGIVLLMSSVRWPVMAAHSLAPARLTFAQQTTPESAEAALAEVRANNGRVLQPSIWRPLQRQAMPHTIIPERPRLGIITYTVQAGDTVESIAAMYNIDPMTIVWSNPAVEDAPDLLRIGQQVIILPIDGVYHTVRENDTLASIADKYDADIAAIISCPYNGLEGPEYAITPGMRLIVPGGSKPYVPRVVTSYTGPVPEGVQGSGLFQWPVLGRITTDYKEYHRAIDIAAPLGTAVLAADDGFVSFAGWTDVGYGYLVVVDHANGFSTYYAHLSVFYVSAGEPVARGQVIGAIGSTGRSTGPHIHFEIRYGGIQQHPRAYLP